MHDGGIDGAGARARTLAQQLSAAAIAGGVRVATAESCTGGLLAATITNLPGASAYYAGGIVAYANDVKVRHLGVDPDALESHGAGLGDGGAADGWRSMPPILGRCCHGRDRNRRTRGRHT